MANSTSHANSENEERKKQEEHEHLKNVKALLMSLTPKQIETAKLIDLQQTIERLDRESKETIPLTRGYFNAFCMMSLSLVVAGTVVAILDRDESKKFDLLSYVFPMLAGWIAGIGVYRRDLINKAFMVSVTLLLIGFGLYLQSKNYLFDALFDSIGFLVLFGCLIFVVLRPANKPVEEAVKKPVEKSVGEKSWLPVFAQILVGLLLVLGFWWWVRFLSTHNQNYLRTFFSMFFQC